MGGLRGLEIKEDVGEIKKVIIIIARYVFSFFHARLPLFCRRSGRKRRRRKRRRRRRRSA